MKTEKRGAKPQYRKPTKIITFRCPENKVKELRKKVNEILHLWKK